MTRPGGGAHGGGSAHDRLAEEARVTASALLEWLSTRVDQAAAPGGSGARPAQSPGPCTWCPVCALVAAMRGEQPELTARVAEQASGFLVLLRAMAQAHDGHSHDPHPAHEHGPRRPAAAQEPATPPGWPTEWGDPTWSATPGPRRAPAPAPEEVAPEAPTGPARGRGGDPTARRSSVRTAAFRPTRANRDDAEAVPAATPAPAPTAPREGPRPSRPAPRRAPARTTSPRTAAFRPSPRAASMPAPGGEAPATAPDEATPAAAPPPAPAADVPRAATEAGRPVAAPPGATPPTPTGGRPRPPVQSISVRRRPDGP